jgi:hypothetical protein
LEYREYLKTLHWQSMRAWAIERAGGHCQICCSRKLLETHHNNYDHLGAEWPEDLCVLCNECHELFSDRFPPEPAGDVAILRAISNLANDDTLSRLEAVSQRMRAARAEKAR